MVAWGGSWKKRVDLLLIVYSRVSAVFGLLALLVPNVAEWMLIHHGDKLRLRDNSSAEAAVTHTIIRLFAALVLAQAWIVHHLVGCDDSRVRRAAIQAFAVQWGVSALALARAQLTHPLWSYSNWVAILSFASLSGLCGHFALYAKSPAFESFGGRLA